mmetsp:Transcript_63186/g.53546  ORF Transcript_63186/g.53546 Transcript_63186/m.53546 type:complete len:106 (+) Transcript_63186:565-882(+)
MVLSVQLNLFYGSKNLHPRSILGKVNQIMVQGNVLLKLKIYHKAILKYFESMSLFKDEKSFNARYLRSKILFNIGLCYNKQEDYFLSLKYCRRSLALDSRNNNIK